MGSTSSWKTTRKLLVLTAALGFCVVGCGKKAPVASSTGPDATVPTAASSGPGDEGPTTPDTRERPLSKSELRLELFVRGEIFTLRGEAVESMGKVPGSAAHLGPPLGTPEGVLAEIGSAGDPLQIWMVGSKGRAELIAPSTQGLAVSPGGGARFAYAAVSAEGQATYGSATIVLAALPGARVLASSDPIQGYARVNGFVGDRVLLSTGEGGTAGVLLWDPASNETSVVESYRNVVATDGASRQAALGRGDGACWSVVGIDEGGTAVKSGASGCDGLEGADFSEDGGHIAGVATDGDRKRLVAYRVWEPDPALDMTMDGAIQALWASPSQILVLVQETNSHQIRLCALEAAGCDVLWSKRTDGTGYGEAWLVASG